MGSSGACCAAPELAGDCHSVGGGGGGSDEDLGERERRRARAHPMVFFLFTKICSDHGLNNPNNRVFCAKMKRFPRST